MLSITDKQASRLGLAPRHHLSPVLEKCCLRLSANESYQNAEVELEALTGIKVGHTTLHRMVQRQQVELPEPKQSITEVSIDGGKVRLRAGEGKESYWRDYKAIRLQGIYYAGYFQDNLSVIDLVNSQRLTTPLICLGDGQSPEFLCLFRQAP